jgi:hypothetical protein
LASAGLTQGMEIVDLGVPRFAGLGMTHQDGLQI